MRVRNEIIKPIKKYVKNQEIKSPNKPMGTYCEKVSGCCYNHLPNKKKQKQEED